MELFHHLEMFKYKVCYAYYYRYQPNKIDLICIFQCIENIWKTNLRFLARLQIVERELDYH